MAQIIPVYGKTVRYAGQRQLRRKMGVNIIQNRCYCFIRDHRLFLPKFTIQGIYIHQYFRQAGDGENIRPIFAGTAHFIQPSAELEELIHLLFRKQDYIIPAGAVVLEASQKVCSRRGHSMNQTGIKMNGKSFVGTLP